MLCFAKPCLALKGRRGSLKGPWGPLGFRGPGLGGGEKDPLRKTPHSIAKQGRAKHSIAKQGVAKPVFLFLGHTRYSPETRTEPFVKRLERVDTDVGLSNGAAKDLRLDLQVADLLRICGLRVRLVVLRDRLALSDSDACTTNQTRRPRLNPSNEFACSVRIKPRLGPTCLWMVQAGG